MTRANSTEFEDFQAALEAVGRGFRTEDEAEAPRHDGPALQMRHHDQLLSMAVESLKARATEQPEASPDFFAKFYADAWSKSQAAGAIERPHQEQVASELNLCDAMSADDLGRLRREFALANHPDRLPLCYREQATRRMMIANTLIDAEIDRRRQSRRK